MLLLIVKNLPMDILVMGVDMVNQAMYRNPVPLNMPTHSLIDIHNNKNLSFLVIDIMNKLKMIYL